MIDVLEAFLVEVVIKDDIMGRSKNYETPETATDTEFVIAEGTENNHVLIPVESEMEWKANVILYEKPNSKGIVLTTGNKFFRRLWLLISNPVRYIFTGKIYY